MSAEQKEGIAPWNGWPKVAVAVDAVVLCVEDGELKVALIQRHEAPYAGQHVLPGGFVKEDEALERAVRRVLKDKVGLVADHVEQLYTFGDPRRDPRTRVVSVAHLVLVRPDRLRKLASGVTIATVDVPWRGEQGGPAWAYGEDEVRLRLGFDHADILGTAVQRLRGKLRYTDVGFAFLPDRFTLHQVRQVFEVVLGRKLNKDSFRRSALANHPVEPTGEREADTPHRPAELFRLGVREPEED